MNAIRLSHEIPMAVPPIAPLGDYVRQVMAYSKLDAEEERELARCFHLTGDVRAVRRLVLAHLRYVVFAVRRYRGFGAEECDLIQEGNIGLMKAVRAFDPQRGVRLATFANRWIKAAIHEFLLRSARLARVATTHAQRKLYFNLNRLRGESRGPLREVDVERIAESLSVRKVDVREMERRLGASDFSLDAPGGEAGEGFPIGDSREDVVSQVEREQLLDRLRGALARIRPDLDERGRAILETRVLSDAPETLDAIALRFAVSRERIRQLEVALVAKLREALLSPPLPN